MLSYVMSKMLTRLLSMSNLSLKDQVVARVAHAWPGMGWRETSMQHVGFSCSS